MIRDEGDRLIICCDSCPVRLDLGLAAAARARNRTPSGWITVDHGRHCCPHCATTATRRMVAEWVRARGPQPLLAP